MMARYRIQDDESAVSVEVTEVGANAQKLLRALRECQAGQCSCPTDEYQKLASMDIQLAGDVISLRLEAKPRETFGTSEIAACLDYTTKQLDD